MHLSLFADDTNGYKSDKTIANLFRRANIELQKIYNWIVSNKLGMNGTKIFYLLFNYTGENELPILKIGDITIPRTSNIKFLGIFLDDRLKWNFHIDSICKKLSKLNGILYIVRNSFTFEALKSIYYS